ncbi:hypothetical protein HDU67_006604 [Dinochytrium kinnereticum]|nr:hypothetical protein HDU67_006604 [Dinochytrium kinnereticum]
MVFLLNTTLFLLVVLTIATSSKADVTITPSVAIQNSLSPFSLRIFRGCSTTSPVSVNITVGIPTEVSFVNAHRVRGWDMVITSASISWSNGNLPGGEYEDFGMLIQVPEAADGTRIFFPVTQTCADFSTIFHSLRLSSASPTPPVTGDRPAPFLTLSSNGTTVPLEVLLKGSGVDIEALRRVAGAPVTGITPGITSPTATFPVGPNTAGAASASLGRGVSGWALGGVISFAVGLVW